MGGSLWWQQPMRAIQTNLQVRDTDKIDPERLAHQIKQMGGNVLVFNTGGIYAWYPSRVPYHHVNEFLPENRDLLAEVISCCHRLDIRFVARFDFSKAQDEVYLQQPRWFICDEHRQPKIYGIERPGPWPLLMGACINAGYRGEQVGLPAFREALENYPIDGVFFNAPTYEFCQCEACRRKYRALYAKPLPACAQELEPDFAARCVRDNVGMFYRAMKQIDPDMPMILYYHLYRNDHLADRLATADVLCTEPMDVLSAGHDQIPEPWLPYVDMKIGRKASTGLAPFGIVHSCPGMQWRHTGVPPAEYRFWMSQIPAAGGNLWCSLTGVPDTVTDRRILSCVEQTNRDAQKIEQAMHGAREIVQVLLLWRWESTARHWAQALLNTQIPFDAMQNDQVTMENLARYQVVIVPEGHPTSQIWPMLEQWTRRGGRLIWEGVQAPESAVQAQFWGIEPDCACSAPLEASYLRLEEGAHQLKKALESTELLAHSGKVNYCTPLARVQVWATLVPPFAPVSAVGAPPERASLPAPKTQIPLCLVCSCQAGQVLYLPFQLGEMLGKYRLPEHFRLVKNMVEAMLPGPPVFQMEPICGLQTAVYEKDDADGGRTVLIHWVNGVGQRPLCTNVPLYDLRCTLRLQSGEAPVCAVSQIAGETVRIQAQPGAVTLCLEKLAVWDVIALKLDKKALKGIWTG